MPLLLDLDHLDHDCVDVGLEALCKASSEGGGSVWDEHPSLLVRRIVELFTQRGLRRSAELTRELQAWLTGARHKPSAVSLDRPPDAMGRWSVAELHLVRTYLQALKPSEFTLDDWMMVVDYLCQRYLPAEDLRTEAEWLTSRAGLMGRVAAAMGEISAAEADTIMTRLPSPEQADELGLTPTMRAVLDYGRARACERIVGLSDTTRHRLRSIVVDHQEALYLKDRSRTAQSLESKLLDAEGHLNLDWRRIAVTETTEMLGQGFVASQKPGTRIKRVEQYRGACPYCRSIDGRIVTVVAPDAQDKAGADQVWVGKTNQGRSASPRKRGPEGLEERPEDERWQIPAGAVHPNCRGRWVLATKASPDPTFDAWLKQMKERRG